MVGLSIRSGALKNYNHLITSEERGGVLYLKVHRVFDDRRDFCTEIPITRPAQGQDVWDEFDRVSSTLGKTLCIDIHPLRAFLGID